ncbi:MAG TPA: phage tail assembly protein [Chthoniobacteraceae bacterium]|nr:phage tail assembly protein [Chthoniobacteraceae bacterium]
MSNKNTINLEYPIDVDGAKLKSITLRRPSVGDMRAAKKAGDGDDEVEIILFANLAGLTPDDIGKLDLADYQKVQEVFRGFLGQGK